MRGLFGVYLKSNEDVETGVEEGVIALLGQAREASREVGAYLATGDSGKSAGGG